MSHTHSHSHSHSQILSQEGGPKGGFSQDGMPFVEASFVGEGESFPETEGLPDFETAEFETFLGDALGPLDDADLVLDDWTQGLPTDPTIAPDNGEAPRLPAGVSETTASGGSAGAASGESAGTAAGESATTLDQKGGRESGSPSSSSFSSSSNLAPADLPLPPSSRLPPPFASSLQSPGLSEIMPWEITSTQFAASAPEPEVTPPQSTGGPPKEEQHNAPPSQIDNSVPAYGLTSPGLSELMAWTGNAQDSNRPNRLTCDAMSGFVWENNAPQAEGSQPADGSSGQSAGVGTSTEGEVSAGSGSQKLVVASCPPGCTCVACDMGLFDWIVPETKSDFRAASFQTRRDSFRSGEGAFAALADPGRNKSDVGLSSPGRKRQQLAWGGWEGNSVGEGTPSSGDIFPRGSFGALNSQQQVNLADRLLWNSRQEEAGSRESTRNDESGAGGALVAARPGRVQEEEKEKESRKAGGSGEGAGLAVVVARPGRGRVDMTNRLAGVIKEIKHKQTGAEVLDMVVTSDRKQQSRSLFRRSRVEELEVAPAARAFLDANLNKVARGGVSTPVAGAGAVPGGILKGGGAGGLGVPGAAASMPAVRQRRSRARPAADGTMRPRAHPAIQVWAPCLFLPLLTCASPGTRHTLLCILGDHK